MLKRRAKERLDFLKKKYICIFFFYAEASLRLAGDSDCTMAAPLMAVFGFKTVQKQRAEPRCSPYIQSIY